MIVLTYTKFRLLGMTLDLPLTSVRRAEDYKIGYEPHRASCAACARAA